MEEERALTIWQSIKNNDFFLFSAEEVLEVFCLAANERIRAFNSLYYSAFGLPGASEFDSAELRQRSRIDVFNLLNQNAVLNYFSSAGSEVRPLDVFSVSSVNAFLDKLGNVMKLPGFIRSFSTDNGYENVSLKDRNGRNYQGQCTAWTGNYGYVKPFLFIRQSDINYSLNIRCLVTLPSGWTFDSFGLLPSGLAPGDYFELSPGSNLAGWNAFTDLDGVGFFAYNLGEGIFPVRTTPQSGFALFSENSVFAYDLSGWLTFG